MKGHSLRKENAGQPSKRRHLVTNKMSFDVGNWHIVKFWTDKWYGDTP